jgi:RNA polymerase sigma-70 factor (ECF subfamily)
MNDNNPLAPTRLTPVAADAQVRAEVFNQHRPLLFSIAYRMLGSVADAEDMVQEAFIRWQQSVDTDVQVPRTFLVTIVSRLCINHLQSARVRREEYVGQWLPEPLLTAVEDDPSARLRIDESLSMAFLVLLERLNPLERAVFLLREVFDYDYPEVARVLGHNEANCRQILRRARQHVAQIRQRFDPSPQQHQMLARRFLAACSEGDVTGLLALLSNEIVVYADGGRKGGRGAQADLRAGPRRALRAGRAAQICPARAGHANGGNQRPGGPGVVFQRAARQRDYLRRRRGTDSQYLHRVQSREAGTTAGVGRG